MNISTKFFVAAFLILATSFVNAQYSQKKLAKFCRDVNENIELIQSNQKRMKALGVESEEKYDLYFYSILTPFIEDEFEVTKPFLIDETGLISMEIKYLNEENPFIYSVKGNLGNLHRAVVDIYFILEFEEDSLTVEYRYLNSGETETVKGNLIHLGIDQVGLVDAARASGIQGEVY